MRMNEGSVDVVPFYQADAALVKLVQAGQLMPLDPLVKRAKFDLKPYGDVADQLRIDGELYDLPVVNVPTVILYNQELFQAAGVPFPKPGWTWDDFRNAATKLKRDGVWGLSGPGTAADQLVLQWLAGRMPGQRVPEAKLLQEALQFFATLAFTDKAIAPSTKLGARYTFTDDFANRRAAMSLEPLSFSSMAGRKLNFRWGVAPFPVTPGSAAGGMITPYTYAIVSNARNADAAWQFLSFACGPEGATALAKAGQVPLYNTPAVRQTWNDKQPAPPAGSDMLFATAWQIPPRAAADAAMDAALLKLINQVMSGDQAAEVALPAYLQEVAGLKADKK
jgi:multiple sugar transport system substrate-binding protein/raffinose/stachyose/melibiose transport system substrate-binding protein